MSTIANFSHAYQRPEVVLLLLFLEEAYVVNEGTESGRIIDVTGQMEDSSFKQNDKRGRYWILCEVVLITAVTLVLVGLFMAPTVFFALPDSAVLQVRY